MEQSLPLLAEEQVQDRTASQPLQKSTIFSRFLPSDSPALSWLIRLVWLIRQVAYAFVPQLIRTYYFKDTLPPPKAHKTSWLDGFRGLAALAVFNLHYFIYFVDIRTPYGKDDKHRWVFELPIIRLFYAGSLAVLVFFLVAGYAICYRSLQLMSRVDDEKAQKSLFYGLSASVFRRYFRLYLPVMAISLISSLCLYMGFYETLRPWTDENSHLMFSGKGTLLQPRRFHTLWHHLTFWWRTMMMISDVWTYTAFFPALDNHLWTIRMEFRASLALYVAMMGLAHTRMGVRLAALIMLSFYCAWWGRWETQLFFWGAVLAQIDVWIDVSKQQRQQRRQDQRRPKQQEEGQGDSGEKFRDDPSSEDDFEMELSEKDVESLSGLGRFAPTVAKLLQRFSTKAQKYSRRPLRLLWNVTWSIAALTAMFLMSSGYAFFEPMIPNFVSRPETQVRGIGGFLLILCLILADETSLSQRFLNSWPVQYLGKIVFSLYLVHGPIMHMGAYMYPNYVWRAMGYGWPTQFEQMPEFAFVVGLTLGYFWLLVVVLWLADVFYREVEERTRWLMYFFQKIAFNKKK